jgi:pyridoxamine 5'-phosphate oxidase
VPDPIARFARWFRDARRSRPHAHDAMTLATATPAGRPSARMVLLKDFGPRGFVFFTDYRSRKGRELAANPRAALVFHWPAQDRQVRMEGRVKRVSAAESDAYFDSRPLGSRLSAAISPQSRRISGRAELVRRRRELEARLGGSAPPRPSSWGGYRLVPERIEFWTQGRARLHDRLLYRRSGGRWLTEWLAP